MGLGLGFGVGMIPGVIVGIIAGVSIGLSSALATAMAANDKLKKADRGFPNFFQDPPSDKKYLTVDSKRYSPIGCITV